MGFKAISDWAWAWVWQERCQKEGANDKIGEVQKIRACPDKQDPDKQV